MLTRTSRNMLPIAGMKRGSSRSHLSHVREAIREPRCLVWPGGFRA
jgi:hypothetical protein